MNTLDKDEWWDVCRSVRPDLTREEFDRQWAEFIAVKAQKARH